VFETVVAVCADKGLVGGTGAGIARFAINAPTPRSEPSFA
jgi:hypothetical protein